MKYEKKSEENCNVQRSCSKCLLLMKTFKIPSNKILLHISLFYMSPRANTTWKIYHIPTPQLTYNFDCDVCFLHVQVYKNNFYRIAER